MDQQSSKADGRQEFLRFVAGAFVVLVILYLGLLAYMVIGPSSEDVSTVRKVTVVVLVFSMICWGLLLFVGANVAAPERGEDRAAEQPVEEAEKAAEVLPISNACPSCGDAVPSRANFCPSCGQRLGGGTESTGGGV